MGESKVDFDLPNASIARIIKASLPEGAHVSREARLAMSKGASIFILYLTAACVPRAAHAGAGAVPLRVDAV